MAESYQVNGGDWLGAITSLPFQALAYNNALENQEYQRQQDVINRKMQYDFAQNSIKWRVNDAKEAGIHPLAALGISPSSASPVYSSSQAPEAMRIDFGDMFRAQVDLVKAETAKAEAEAEAIKGQDTGQLDPSNPSGIVRKTLKVPEKTGRVTENPAKNGVVKSYRVEPNQPELDKYESLGLFNGMVQYLSDYRFNDIENLRRAEPEIADNLRKMAKKQGVDFDANFSLSIVGSPALGYTLDLIPHDNIDKFIRRHEDRTSAYKKRALPPKYKDKHLVRPKYNW